MARRLRVGQQVDGFRILAGPEEHEFGVAYKAEQVALGRTVLLRSVPDAVVSDPALNRSLKRAVGATSAANRPGFVQVYDYQELAGRPYYVVEYLDPGEWCTLADVLERETTLPVNLALRIAQRLLEGLAAAHSAGLCHGMICADSVMMRDNGEVKLEFFGLPGLRGGNGGAPASRSSRTLAVHRNLREVGALLYQMMAGMDLHEGIEIPQDDLPDFRLPAALRHIHPELAPDVETIVRKALDSAPGRGYSSAEVMLAALERYFRKQPYLSVAAASATRRADDGAEEPGVFLLEILGEDTGFRVGFTSNGRALQTLTRNERLAVDAQRVQEWSRKATAIVQQAAAAGGGTPEHLAALKAVGQRMFDNLLTESAKHALAATTCRYLVLRLDDAAVGVPWELLFDGKQFLCRRFCCGRIVATNQEVRATTPRVPGETPRFLLISNPRGDLEAASVECLSIKEDLANLGTVSVRLRNAVVTCEQLEQDLREADLVHYSGHARHDADDPTRCGWLLSDGLFGPQDVRRISAGRQPMPRVLFVNACQSAVAEAPSEEPLRRMFSVANAYLVAGVETYIGTMGDVLDAHAAEFALSFYAEALRGRTAGEALKHARELIAQHCGDESLIWASYLMYGDPTKVLFASAQAAGQADAQEHPGVEPSEAIAELAAAARAEKAAAASARAAARRWMAGVGIAAAVALVFVGFAAVLGLGWLGRQPATAQQRVYSALRTGDYDVAQRALEQAQQSGYAWAAEGLAALAWKQGRLADAAQFCGTALEAGAEAAYARVIQGFLALEEGDFSVATEAFRAALAGPLNYSWQRAEALAGLGRALAAAGSAEEAVEPLEQAVALDRDLLEAYRTLGRVYTQLGRDEDAARALEAIVHRAPRDPWAAYMKQELRERRDEQLRADNMRLVIELIERFDNPAGSSSTRAAAPPQTTGEDWDSRILGVTVLPLRVIGGSALDDADADYLLYLLNRALSDVTRVTVVDRRLLLTMLNELRLGQKGLVDTDSAVHVGRLFSARVVLTGEIYRLPAGAKVVLTAVDTETSAHVAFCEADVTDGFESTVAHLVRCLTDEVRRTYPLQGRVSVADGGGMELNIGQEHGVSEGMLVDVFEEEGAAPQRPVAQARVTRVMARSCRAEPLATDVEIKKDYLVREAESK